MAGNLLQKMATVHGLDAIPPPGLQRREHGAGKRHLPHGYVPIHLSRSELVRYLQDVTARWSVSRIWNTRSATTLLTILCVNRSFRLSAICMQKTLQLFWKSPLARSSVLRHLRNGLQQLRVSSRLPADIPHHHCLRILRMYYVTPHGRTGSLVNR